MTAEVPLSHTGVPLSRAEVPFSAGTAWAHTDGVSPPALGQMAGPVEAIIAAETGGQVEGTVDHSQVGSGAFIPPYQARSSLYRAFAAQADAMTGESILTSAKGTSEVAVAPAYEGLSGTESAHTGVAVTQTAVEGQLPRIQVESAASADGLALFDEAEAAEASTPRATATVRPENRVGTSAQVVRPTGSSWSEGSLLTSSLTEGLSSEKHAENQEVSGEAIVGVEEVETPFEDVEPAVAEKPSTTVLPAADAAAGAVEAAPEADKMASAVQLDAPKAQDTIRRAREISETLLRESLKRLPRSVELRLDPPQLGSVTALLSQRGQDVTVKFVAHSNEAQQMLETATKDLARALSEKGLTLTGFSVDPGYSGEKGREHKQSPDKPSTSRYHRTVRPLRIAGTPTFRQPAGAFSWLA
ncbi:MAG: flagellar hook-length control protein FliK [Bacillota bacterium]